MSKLTNTLRAFWSKKEGDILIEHPYGQGTRADAGYMASIFNKKFIKELQARGYDISTLKFQVNPITPSDRFPTPPTS